MIRLIQKILSLMFLISAVLNLSCSTSLAQSNQIATSDTVHLDQIIEMAMEKSISSHKASTLLENRYWQYRTYKSNYKPQLQLEGILPEFNRSIHPITQPDGSVLFQPIANNNSFINLGLSQAVSATGGEIFINSVLQRFDDFDQNYTMYNHQPAVVGFRQPFFAFNSLVWDRKIEPLRYEESKKAFTEEMEAIQWITSRYYFDLLQAQIDLEIARKNLANNDTILKISNVKYNLGKISKGELLQLELAKKNSQKALAQAKLSFENALLQLSSYTGATFNEEVILNVPSIIPQMQINEELALSEARKNRQKYLSLKRTILEAEKEVAKARGENGLNATLFASFGLTKRADHVNEIFNDIQNQQTVKLGFYIPLVDWGRSASRIKTAQANYKLASYSMAQEEIIFNQEIYTQISQYKMLEEQVKLTFEADLMAKERYNIFKNSYLIGELTFTDLNIAQQEKDQATRDYINTVRDFWLAFYNLRLLTLYDFEKQTSIIYTNELYK